MRKGYLITGLVICLLHAVLFLSAQVKSVSRVIQWDKPDDTFLSGPEREESTVNKTLLHFSHAIYIYPDTLVPVYHESVKGPDIHDGSEIKIGNFIFQPLQDQKGIPADLIASLSDTITIDSKLIHIRKQPVIEFTLIPLRRNPGTGVPEKLVYFTYQIDNSNVAPKGSSVVSTQYSSSSVLASGIWVKIRIPEDGIYKLSYSDLVSMGLANPSNPRIFGNGGAMLPFNSAIPRPDDLTENAILFEKGSDGVFNQGDYILFYGKGPGNWYYKESEQQFNYRRHLYSEAGFYFITSDAGSGKTIDIAEEIGNSENHVVDCFDDFQIHEVEAVNLIKSGREWYEPIVSTGENIFTFSFQNIDITNPAKLKSRLLARSSTTSTYTIYADGNNLVTGDLPAITGLYQFANARSNLSSFLPANEEISISIQFNNPGAETWLDYLILNVRRHLIMEGTQMHFRDIESVGTGNISLFQLSGATPVTRIWDITDLTDIKEIPVTYGSGQLEFKVQTDSLREFIAFDDAGFLTPEVGENPVPNQNLHGLGPVDMIIVSHSDFISQANQLADIHRSKDNLATEVVTPEMIYNEFSSGAPDVTAIRDFVKMFYDRAVNEDEMPEYLLLFGDGSYDNLSDHENNTNRILTYQSVFSDNDLITSVRSYVTDDFFGLLDDGEEIGSGKVDIGIGRFPVTTTEEAETIINKVMKYLDPEAMGSWRNTISFIGDDLDGNDFDGTIHMSQADALATDIESTYPAFDLEKIYLDAYPQVSTSRGEAYPEVNNAINDRIHSGTLIINYLGHGNERGLAHEGILNLNDILSWTNSDKLPLFITATCEFSRFDDVDRTVAGEITEKNSAGEYVLLHPGGGGIALLTTTRLVYSSSNFVLNQKFYQYAFTRDENGNKLRLGDIIRLSKNDVFGTNKRNFTLLGDPALELAYPRFNVITDSINGETLAAADDTLKALSKVTISGHVADETGNILNGFSGTLFPAVYDKPVLVTTLGNDPHPNDTVPTPLLTFKVQKNILYRGQVSIINGRFTFSFVIPKDISYNIDFGKISYYGKDSTNDAHGFNNQILIGGFSDDQIIDNTGPEISLFMNDRNFISGGITDENPRILALVSDVNGINTVGNGIGHDITAILDDDYINILVLNDYYEADLNSYQSGKIEYQLTNLSKGNHHINLKVWDVLNNSSEARIEFIVAESTDMVIEDLFNYPNPFTERTSFVFEHNQTDGELEVVIRIFDLSGQNVKTIRESFYTDGYRIGPIDWDGRDDGGNKLASGIYVYRVDVRSSNGNRMEAFQKLVIVK
ncbi:MAG: type IX secretion system sortase PorU [Bacteroidales bacterium]|nr:MAG: type IX secretion system sortase PorU [Bacteroidales bacterium]